MQTDSALCYRTHSPAVHGNQIQKPRALCRTTCSRWPCSQQSSRRTARAVRGAPRCTPRERCLVFRELLLGPAPSSGTSARSPPPPPPAADRVFASNQSMLRRREPVVVPGIARRRRRTVRASGPAAAPTGLSPLDATGPFEGRDGESVVASGCLRLCMS